MHQDTQQATRIKVGLSSRTVILGLVGFSIAAGVVMGGLVFPGKKIPATSANVSSQSLSGRIVTVFEDYEDEQVTVERIILETNIGDRYTLTGSRELLSAFSPGQEVRVTGQRSAEQFVVESGTVLGQQGDSFADDGGSGERRTVGMSAHFQNDLREPWVPEDVRAALFTSPTSVNAFYRENSLQKMWLTGGIVEDWLTLPIDQTCNINVYSRAAIAAADPDVDYREIDHVVVFLPRTTGCPNGAAYTSPQSFTTDEGVVSLRFASIIKTPGSSTEKHEFAHTFFLGHAASYDCGAVPLAPPCSAYDYGDPWSVMSIANSYHHNAYHKRSLGWFAADQTTTVTENGTYRIEPIETASAGPKVLRVPIGNQPPYSLPMYLYLEYRQPIGFDNTAELIQYHADNGVLVHYPEDCTICPPDSNLLDFTPGSPDGFLDSVLLLGQTFTFNGVTIRPISRDASGIDVSVTVNPALCVEQPPTMTLDPPAVQIIRVNGVAQPVPVVFRVTNNDSAACPSDSFPWKTTPLYFGGQFSGWSTPTIMLNPGETSTTTWLMLPDPATTAGTYTYPIHVSHFRDPVLNDTRSLEITLIDQTPGGGQSPAFLKVSEPSPPLELPVPR